MFQPARVPVTVIIACFHMGSVNPFPQTSQGIIVRKIHIDAIIRKFPIKRKFVRFISTDSPNIESFLIVVTLAFNLKHDRQDFLCGLFSRIDLAID